MAIKSAIKNLKSIAKKRLDPEANKAVYDFLRELEMEFDDIKRQLPSRDRTGA